MAIIGRKNKAQRLELEYSDVVGYLTKEDIQKLKSAGKRPANPHRKRFYKTWVCRKCKNSCFYTIIRCPLCGSTKIDQVSNRSRMLDPDRDTWRNPRQNNQDLGPA